MRATRALAVVIGVAALVSLSVEAGPAFAFSSFGTRYYGSSSTGAGAQEYGSATTIQVPRPGNHTVNDYELSSHV